MWKLTLQDEDLSKELVHTPPEDADFRAKGEKYVKCSDMYYAFLQAETEAVMKLTPATLSLWGIQTAFVTAEMEMNMVPQEGMDRVEPVGDLITEAIQVTSGLEAMKKRKRVKCVDSV